MLDLREESRDFLGIAGGWSLSRGSDKWELKLKVSNEGDEVLDLSLDDQDLEKRLKELSFCEEISVSSKEVFVKDSLETLVGEFGSFEYSKLWSGRVVSSPLGEGRDLSSVWLLYSWVLLMRLCLGLCISKVG